LDERMAIFRAMIHRHENRPPRVAPCPEPLTDRDAKRPRARRKNATDEADKQLLDRKIREFHPNTAITQRCLAMMRFRDRGFTDPEKITLLEMCNCYTPESKRLALLNYIGYMRRQDSKEFNLAGALRRFRESPPNLIPVFSNEYIVQNTSDIRRIITAPQKKPEHHSYKADDEL